MRQLFLAAVATAAVCLAAGLARADKVELKGAHICCGNCEKGIKEALSKVDGVSEVTCSRPDKTVTFTAKDDKTATAGVKALLDAGYFGAATDDAKELKVDVDTPKKGDKADEVTVKNVHVCCGMCKKALTGLFEGSKVDFPDKGQVKISGKDLDKAAVIDALRKAGFNGTIDK